MRWTKLRRSKQVIDRRGRGSASSSGRPLAMKGGCGTIILVLILALFFNVDVSSLLMNQGPTPASSPHAEQQEVSHSQASNQFQEFIERIKGSLEYTWSGIFREYGKQYRPAKMISYTGATRMKSGSVADARMGPFYAPQEETIYLDLTFFQKMATEFKAKGDFAYAYVIAHEAAHHVQKLLGQTQRVHQQMGRVSKEEYNRLSVRLELQADFLAGVWAHHADRTMRAQHGTSLLEKGDIEEAIRATKAIGDDALQMLAQGFVIKDSFTHGTSEQRYRWFMKGFQSGDLQQADTFSIPFNQL